MKSIMSLSSSSICLFLLLWTSTSRMASSFLPHQHSCDFSSSVPKARQQGSLATSPQDYLEKVEQIRAEIAALEGKSLSQVQDEAMEKKQKQREELEMSKKKKTHTKDLSQFGRALEIPITADDMILQAARAVERAVTDGIYRQTVRLALVDEASDQSIYDSADNMWPGGVVQMSRQAAKPLGTELLKHLRWDEDASYRTTVVEEQDVWDFDGSALLSTKSSRRNTTAMVFPNTDVKYIQDLQRLDETAADEDVILLLNPFWRDIDSWGINLLAPGAKRKAQQVIFDRGFQVETYHCMRFRCRGEECIAVKAYPYDWQIYAYLDEYSPLIRLGESKVEPKSELVTEMLNQRPEFKLSKTMRQMQR